MLNWRRAGRSAIGAALTWAVFAAQSAAGQVPIPVPRPEFRAAAAAPAVVFKKAPVSNSSPGVIGAIAMPSVTPRQSGSVGWMVMDLDSGAVLDAQAADVLFAPASVAKLPKALYALDRLGPEFRFETRVAATGPVRNETLEGDLILVGGGDPELDSDSLLPLVTQVKEKGFRRIRGQFLVDGSIGPRQPGIAGDQPVDAAYNPAVSGLNLNFNRVRLEWDARGKAKTLRVSALAERVDSDITGVRVAIADVPGAPMFSHALEGRAEVWRMNEVGLRGKGARWLPVRQPEFYTGEVFQNLAATYGIALDPAREGVAPPGAEVIARQQSRPLAPMLRSMLRYSTNLTAEMVGLAATRAGGLEPSSLAGSAAGMNAWAAEMAGFPVGDPGFQLVNHSGLATESRVSPRRMVEVLAAAARRNPEAGTRYPRLPGGVTELLRDYNVAIKSVKMDYKHLDIAAKTGTMDYVRGLAGYIATPKGRRLAFAIFSNDIERRPNDPIRSVDKRWMAQARDFERSLIRAWVRTLDG
jgi:D-alanyl-D-alanine carboxypeptidase/D-alanyl-D-alanine-endopeptidase (penicillin-binding protein 4)